MNTDPSGYWFKQKEGYKTWAIKEPEDTWFTLFDFLGIDYGDIGYEGNFGEVPERYLMSNPVVIIACGWLDNNEDKINDIPCTHGTLASLDLYEKLGDVKRVPMPAWEGGAKWGMASEIKRLMESTQVGPVYLVGHSAGGDAVTASLSIITAGEKMYKLGGAIIIDPTLTASVHEDVGERCPEEIDYINFGDMAHILLNSTLGKNRLVIYDSPADGYDLTTLEPKFVNGADNYSFLSVENANHLALASTVGVGLDAYNFAMDSLKLPR